MKIRLAMTVPCTESEGIGKRFAIWTQGCKFACKGCCNPHLWSHKGGYESEIEDVVKQVKFAKEKYGIEGVTFIGGEPLEQPLATAELCKQVQALGLTTMVFTGFTLAQVKEKMPYVLDHIDLLKTGLYDEKLRTTKIRFIGSTNQELHFLTSAYDKNDPRWAEPNTAEIKFNDKGELTIVGFPFDSLKPHFKSIVTTNEK